MSVGLAGIIERAVDVIEALTPTTTATTTFVSLSPDLGVESEPQVQHRGFEVAPAAGSGPTLTGEMLGPSAAQFRATFDVTVLYDAQTDFNAANALALEDAEQIIFALESDVTAGSGGMPAGTRTLRCTGTTLVPGTPRFFRSVLSFETTYDRTF
jgi:hypothetical protein